MNWFRTLSVVALAMLLIAAVRADAVDIKLVDPGTIVPWSQNGTTIDPNDSGQDRAATILDDLVFASSNFARADSICQWAGAINGAFYKQGFANGGPSSNSNYAPFHWPLECAGSPDGNCESDTRTYPLPSSHDDHYNSCVVIDRNLAGYTIRQRINDHGDASNDPLVGFPGPDGMLPSADDVAVGSLGGTWKEYAGVPDVPLAVSHLDPKMEAIHVCECSNGTCFNLALPGYDSSLVTNGLPCYRQSSGVPLSELTAPILYPQSCDAGEASYGLCLDTNDNFTEGHLRTKTYGSSGDAGAQDWHDGFAIVFHNEYNDTYNPLNGILMHLKVPGWSDLGLGSGRSLRVRAYSCGGVELTPPGGVGGVVDARHGLGALVPQVITSTTLYTLVNGLVIAVADMDKESRICAVQVDSPDGLKFHMDSFNAFDDHSAVVADILPDDATRYTNADFVGYATEYEYVAGQYVSSPTDSGCGATQNLSVHFDLDRDGAHHGDFGCGHQPNSRQHPGSPLEEPFTGPALCLQFADFDSDGDVDATDYSSYFLPAFQAGSSGGDLNCDGTTDATDFALFLGPFEVGLP